MRQVTALTATTGKVRWRQSGDITGASLVTGDGALYVAVTNGSPNVDLPTPSVTPRPFAPGETLQAIRLDNGATRWNVTLNNQFIPFAERRGVLYTYVLSANAQVPISHSLVVAFNANTGAQLWATALTGTISGQPLLAQDSLAIIMASAPDANNGNQMTPSAVSLRLSDGHVLWTITGSERVGPSAQTLTDGGLLYSIGPSVAPADPNATIMTYQIRAFNLATGQLQWTQTYPDVGLAPMVVAKGVICFLAFPTGGASLNAIRGSDGARLWSVPVASTSGELAISQSAIEVMSGQLSGAPVRGQVSAYALATGATMWRATIAEGLATDATATDGALYLATTVIDNAGAPDTSAAEARNATTGALEWRQPITGSVSSLTLSA